MGKWLPIKDYEDLYEVSNEGQIRSLCGRYGFHKILKQGKGSRGYSVVSLCRKGEQKTVNVHRIVAITFIPNPHNLPCINHKDGNRQNNSVSNLEWCSYYYNNVYGDRLTKSALKRGKPIMCIETKVKYASASDAYRKTGISQSHISACCNHKREKAGKLHWEFL